MRSIAAARRGFTLVELLVVLAIISILAGILYPVFATARRAAIGAHCLTNFSKVGKATILYAGDYDDRLLPVNHRPGMAPDARLDRTWPQILLPYVRDFRTFDCPAEPNAMEFGGAFDPDLLPGDYAARYYAASLHSDLGYNSYYLSPIVREGDAWVAVPRSMGEVNEPSRTLLYVESRAGSGGSYVVSPPCRFVAKGDGAWVDTFSPIDLRASVASLPSTDGVYTPVAGWSVKMGTAMPYGGVWERHGNRLNIARIDGGVKSAALGELMEGCDVKPDWQGTITDTSRYLWFPQS